MAKQHKEKFTHISPVWYQLKLEDGAPLLTGGHDLDADWMRDLRTPADEVSLLSFPLQQHRSTALSSASSPSF